MTQISFYNMTGQKDKKETEEMATKINISYSLKQNGIVSCWWHSVAGANRYSAFIRLVANGKAIGTKLYRGDRVLIK